MFRRILLVGFMVFTLFNLFSCQKKEVKPEVSMNHIETDIYSVTLDIDVKDYAYKIIDISAVLLDKRTSEVIYKEDLLTGINHLEFKDINKPSDYIIQVKSSYINNLDKTVKNKVIKESKILSILYPIYTVENLQNIDRYCDYILKKDIIISDPWETIEMFHGSIDGDGHHIIGLDHPLFGTITQETKIKNLGFLDTNIRYDTKDIGVLARINQGDIQSVYAKGAIFSLSVEHQIGGLVVINQGTIKQSFTDLSIHAKGLLGGIAASNSGLIENSYSVGEIKAKQSTVGGLVGQNSGTIDYSYASNTISNEISSAIEINVGGIAGINTGKIQHSFTDAEILLTGNPYYIKYGSIAGKNDEGSLDDNFRFIAYHIKINEYDSQNFIDYEDIKPVNNLSTEMMEVFNKDIWILQSSIYPTLIVHAESQNITEMTALTSSYPMIFGPRNRTIKLGQSVDLKDGVTAYDKEDGLLDVVLNISDTSDLEVGVYRLNYDVSDKDRHHVQETSTLVVVDDSLDNQYASISTVNNLGVPMIDADDFSQYLYTMVEKNINSKQLRCNLSYLSCKTLVDTFQDFFYDMYPLHPYYSIEEIEYTVEPGYMQINTMTRVYSDKMIDEIDIKADYILSEILSPTMTDRGKIQAISKYITDKVDYDYHCYQYNDTCNNSYNAYGVFYGDKVVCDGYSQAFDILARKLGFITHRLPSVEEGNHVWNVIYLDGRWYHIDLTWEDDSPGDYILITDAELIRLDPTVSHQYDREKFNYINFW